MACLCFVLVVLTLLPPSPLPSPHPTPPPPPCERQSAPAGFLDAGSGARRDGAATSLHSLAFSLSLSLPSEHLLHHCSATINSSVQISCKLPKQTSVLTSAPQHTHIHTGHPSIDLLGNNTHTPRVAVLISAPWSRWKQTHTDSICVWPNSCWHKYLFSNSVPSKNGSADVRLFNDKLLMSLSTL